MTKKQIENIIKLAMVAHTRRLICDTLETAPYFYAIMSGSQSMYNDALLELEVAEMALAAAIDEVRK